MPVPSVMYADSADARTRQLFIHQPVGGKFNGHCKHNRNFNL
ncbi:MAG: hypothetical protein SNJ71_00440 [Bacteroidales bacterium]